MRARRISRSLRYALFLVLFTLFALELILRFYYPFTNKVRGREFELATNTTYRLVNDFNPRLDSIIIHHRNSLGFRGEEPHRSASKLFVLAIGGSTTACTYLSEGQTWCDVLKEQAPDQLIVNNAGLDGHSSFGHIAIMKYYLPGLPVKPDLVLFLCGANDVDRDDLPDYSDSLQGNTGKKIKRWLKDNSETARLYTDLKNKWFPNDIYSDRRYWNFRDFEPLDLPTGYIDSCLKKQDRLLKNYEYRLQVLSDLCRAQGITPVFINQSLAYPDFGAKTNVSGDPLQRMNEMDNGGLFHRKLRLYNESTRKLSERNGLVYIDLFSQVPADTAYYYDPVHYTRKGADTVGRLVYRGLQPLLDSLRKARIQQH